MQIVWHNHKVKKKAEMKAASNVIARRRLRQLTEAVNFNDIPSSAKAHFLEGDKKGKFAVDFDYPARLICEPCGEYVKDKDQYNKSSITSIEILDIETDYHS